MFRIIKIKVCKTCKEVSVSIYRDENSNDSVLIDAWHEHEGNKYFQQAQVEFKEFNNQFEMMKDYVLNFSEFAANQFANSMQF